MKGLIPFEEETLVCLSDTLNIYWNKHEGAYYKKRILALCEFWFDNLVCGFPYKLSNSREISQ